jgi:hypothetical protein
VEYGNPPLIRPLLSKATPLIRPLLSKATPLIRPLLSKATPLIRPLLSKATPLIRPYFRCTELIKYYYNVHLKRGEATFSL